MEKVLAIAGSDSGAGAGIQADLKTFAAFGTYGTCAITALTAQNTMGVEGIYNIPSGFVAKQIDAVMIDIEPKTWKTGMLGSCEIIEAVCDRAKHYKIKKLIVDPVMIAKGGDWLLEKDVIGFLIKYLMPLSFILTPNCLEAEVLSGVAVKTLSDMKEAAIILHEMGCKNIIIKSGRLVAAGAIDIFYDGKTFYEIGSKRIKSKNTHGTGCTFASAIAAGLANGDSPLTAIKNAKYYIHEAIKKAVKLNIGKGLGPLNHIKVC